MNYIRIEVIRAKENGALAEASQMIALDLLGCCWSGYSPTTTRGDELIKQKNTQNKHKYSTENWVKLASGLNNLTIL